MQAFLRYLTNFQAVAGRGGGRTPGRRVEYCFYRGDLQGGRGGALGAFRAGGMPLSPVRGVSRAREYLT